MKEEHIKLAIKNISKYGDTDIFPFPIENHIFYDNEDALVKFILNLHTKYMNEIEENPPQNINSCSAIGYTGLRWATQIEPYWNLYFLSLVISIGDNIELSRINKEEEVVHSYRFLPNDIDGTLFDKSYNWHSFQQSSLEMVGDESPYEYIVICDIADFYSRIYHHRLENSFNQLELKSDEHRRIMNLLKSFSGSSSYGLPIGGGASRILAELILINMDSILRMNNITYKRFVDDIHIFAETKGEAHSHLNTLAISLMTNDGLTLQKHKTQILTKSEFSNIIESKLKGESDEQSSVRAKFMSLPINFDPYSDNPGEDYALIKSEIEKFDILGLLNTELKKTRIHQTFSKHLLKSFKSLDDDVVSLAFISISERLELLSPIFPSIIMSAYSNFEKLNETAKEKLYSKLRELVTTNSYLLQFELNASYMVRLIGKENNSDNERILILLYKKFYDSVLVKSWIIQVFGRWKNQVWWSDNKKNYPTMTNWERRAFYLSSYSMKDEGKHWRKIATKGLSEFEKIIESWAQAKKDKDQNWILPL